MDEGRKRVIGIMAAILASMHMERADDLFGGPPHLMPLLTQARCSSITGMCSSHSRCSLVESGERSSRRACQFA